MIHWICDGSGVHKATIRQGFVALYIAPVANGEHLVRVNGVEVKRYPGTLDEAKALAVKAAHKLLRDTIALLEEKP